MMLGENRTLAALQMSPDFWPPPRVFAFAGKAQRQGARSLCFLHNDCARPGDAQWSMLRERLVSLWDSALPLHSTCSALGMVTTAAAARPAV